MCLQPSILSKVVVIPAHAIDCITSLLVFAEGGHFHLEAEEPSQPNTKKQSGARVLTSRECLDLLKEKEMKKQKEKEEKEKRKLERERKKEEREKELQRKAEERARRAAEKARKQAEKEKKTQERIAERAKKAQEKASKAPATRKRPRSTAIPTETRPLDKEPRSKTPKVIDDSIDFDRCCACFGLYADDAGTDREWIECSCSRWIHEDCVENVIDIPCHLPL